MIYYHYQCPYYHTLHHKNQNTYYSVEFWDIVMNTRCDNVEIEDQFYMMPYLLGVGLFTMYFIDSKYDFIKKCRSYKR